MRGRFVMMIALGLPLLIGGCVVIANTSNKDPRTIGQKFIELKQDLDSGRIEKDEYDNAKAALLARYR